MFEAIKANIFTIHGVVTSLIHMFLFVGIVSSYIFFRVEFLGEDASISIPTAASMKGRK